MSESSQIKTVAISGGTGMVGTALAALLQQEGKSVLAISRQQGSSYDQTLRWDPETGLTNPARLESVDAIVHLAGENIASGRWNRSVKNRIHNSRTQGTRNLVKSIAMVEKPPRVLVSASAIGYYGDRAETELTESAAPGEGFLAEVCKDWEAEADAAVDLGLRVVKVRIGIVLSPQGGALANMLLPFKLGVGGVIGSGKQYWSWIGLHDLTRVLAFCINNESLNGVVNAVSPQSTTNREFTKTLGSVLHRPTILPMPAFAARLALGEMADALLLSSCRAVPQALQSHGFEFQHPELEDCLKHELSMNG
ncbi:MAG: TIGR01777 family oxidoreductase [Planctomycetaceae bacterium]